MKTELRMMEEKSENDKREYRDQRVRAGRQIRELREQRDEWKDEAEAQRERKRKQLQHYTERHGQCSGGAFAAEDDLDQGRAGDGRDDEDGGGPMPGGGGELGAAARCDGQGACFSRRTDFEKGGCSGCGRPECERGLMTTVTMETMKEREVAFRNLRDQYRELLAEGEELQCP